MANNSKASLSATDQHSPKTYLALRYAIPEEEYEAAYTALAFIDYIGIDEGNDELYIYMNITDKSIIDKVNENFIHYNIHYKFISCETITEKNWNKEWEDSIEPVRITDTITITPSWKAHLVESPIVLIINPQMSFGSGHHETTAMMAELVSACVLPGSIWIDAGTGTGVLAILAARCGASSVLAFDNDEWSALNARENIERNAIPPHSIHVMQADVHTMLFNQAHGIAANLHKNLLTPNLQRFYDTLFPEGHLLISGLLRYDTEEMIAAAESVGFTHRQTLQRGEWIALHFLKP